MNQSDDKMYAVVTPDEQGSSWAKIELDNFEAQDALLKVTSKSRTFTIRLFKELSKFQQYVDWLKENNIESDLNPNTALLLLDEISKTMPKIPGIDFCSEYKNLVRAGIEDLIKHGLIDSGRNFPPKFSKN